MKNVNFSEEHELFRESLREFLQKEVVPHIEKWEKTGQIERFIWTKMGEMGYFGLASPEEYGGLDLDIFYRRIATCKQWRFCCSNVGSRVLSDDALKS